MNLIFDSHAHYNDKAFDGDRELVLAGLERRGVGNIVEVCAALDDIPGAIKLTEKYDFVYAAVGVHPDGVGDLSDSNFTEIADALKEKKVVAVGEIGLDYHYDDIDKAAQKYWFARQIDLAREEKYPIIIHSRDAAADTLDIVKAENARDAGGVVHCFSYEKEMARIYLDLGFYIGIGGVLTFKNARKLKEVVEYMPMEQMLLETDCPYLAPTPHRGERNDSGYLPLVVDAISALKGIDREEVIGITRENAERMYKLS